MVMQLPEGDRYSMSYKWMISRLAIMMGGRVAEELTFGKENITSGASSDIVQATKLARAMVTEWGFSDELGQVPTARTSRKCSSAIRLRSRRMSLKQQRRRSTAKFDV
jgi:ATP-dependent Zn protease